MINYDPAEVDSLFLAADTLWLYTIAVLPPTESADSTATAKREERGELSATDSIAEEQATPPEAAAEMPKEEGRREQREATKSDNKESKPSSRTMERGNDARATERREGIKAEGGEKRRAPMDNTSDTITHRDSAPDALRDSSTTSSARENIDSMDLSVDSIATDTTIVDTLPPTAKQLRYRAKLAKRRVRDSLRAERQALRDSIDSINRHESDSIRHIKDSILRIKLDTIIAKRREQSSRIADEEKARIERIKQKSEERNRRKIDKAKARALRRGKEYTGPDYTIDSLIADSTSTSRNRRDSMGGVAMSDSLTRDSLGNDTLAQDSVTRPFPADSTYKMIKAYRRVRMYRSDTQLACDSLVALNTDSIIRLYRDPVMWNETNQITADSMAIYTSNQNITKAHFMGDPLMIMEIDTMYYNQVKGKDMTAHFSGGRVYRNDVDGNAQTIYYMQNEDNPEVTGLMYIESASITFYLVDKEIDKISYKQNPSYVIYPMAMIPETQELRLKDFDWYYDKRPSRDSVFDRTIRATRREDASVKQKPRFRITDRINYDRRRLVENGEWEDRVDELTPEVIEWRNTRTSYNK
jgi:hypothetical protein